MSKIQAATNSSLILDEPLLDRFKCSLCCGLLRQPIQTKRGMNACISCYQKAKRQDGACPIDHVTGDDFFRDKAKEREVNCLKCFCCNKQFGCTWEGSVQQVQMHECSVKKCELCGVHQSTDLTSHIQTCEGIYHRERCIVEGCSYKAPTTVAMHEHMKENMEAHMNLLIAQVAKLKQQNDKEREQFQQRLKDVNEEQKKIETQLSRSIQSQEDFQKACSEQTAFLLKAVNDRQGTSTQPFDEVNRSIRNNTNSVRDVELRLQLHENMTHNGRLVWKLDNYQKRLQEAIIGKITALHSAPFFVAQYGYKICLRVYLNGDGMGKGTHISLFVVIMRSEYDNILSWPFQKHIKLTLINQNNRMNDVIERLVPNKDSSSFQQPKKEMNIASGCPFFAKSERLEEQGFVKNDALYFDVEVK